MKQIIITLQVLLDSIEKILQYTDGYDFEKFLQDERTFDACLMQFQHLGEQTNKYKDELQTIDFLPIEEMIGLRNYIAHEYLGMSAKIIFYTIESELPKLRDNIQAYISQKS